MYMFMYMYMNWLRNKTLLGNQYIQIKLVTGSVDNVCLSISARQHMSSLNIYLRLYVYAHVLYIGTCMCG